MIKDTPIVVETADGQVSHRGCEIKLNGQQYSIGPERLKVFIFWGYVVMLLLVCFGALAEKKINAIRQQRNQLYIDRARGWVYDHLKSAERKHTEHVRHDAGWITNETVSTRAKPLLIYNDTWQRLMQENPCGTITVESSGTQRRSNRDYRLRFRRGSIVLPTNEFFLKGWDENFWYYDTFRFDTIEWAELRLRGRLIKKFYPIQGHHYLCRINGQIIRVISSTGLAYEIEPSPNIMLFNYAAGRKSTNLSWRRIEPFQ